MSTKEKRFPSSCFVLVLWLCVSFCVFACDNTFAEVGSPGKAFEQNKKLGRGINLSADGSLEGITEKDFQIIKDAGFNSVRQVINWSAHSQETPPYAVESAWFDRVDWAVKQAQSRNLHIVLDFHYYPLFGFTGLRKSSDTFENSRARFLSLWRQIAEHYKDAPDSVLFEVMNEPCNYLGPRRWNQLIEETIPIIRKTNPARTIIVGPEFYQQIFALDNLKLPEDDRNIIVAIHCYTPAEFTHQGASYVPGLENLKDIKWKGTMVETGQLIMELYRAAAWGDKHNRPLTLNEFGAINNADMESSARYHSFITREMEKLEMSWAVWCYDSALWGKYDRSTNSWRKPILDALIPPKN
jgi:endoglucanase